MTELSTEEQNKVKEFLEAVGTRDSNNGSIPYNTAVKFLMARKFEVQRAVNLYFAHEDIRQREGLSVVDPTDERVKLELLTEKFTILPGRDNSGAVIALFNARYHQPERSTHSDCLKGLVFQLDSAIESTDAQRNGLVFIYDMTASRYSNFDYDLSIKILNMLKGCYPARLKKVLIVTAPLWFKAPFKILRLFVREKLRDRVFTASVRQLPLHVPRTSLPRRLGGDMEMNHREWLAACLQLYWGKHVTIDQDIAAYFENMDLPLSTTGGDMSVSSISSTITSTTGENTDDNVFDDNDLLSKSTVSEKQNSEYREKELRIENMDASAIAEDNNVASSSPPDTPNRGSDESSSLSVSSESSPVGHIQRKKRPLSDDVDDSIHGPESGGLSIKDFVAFTRIKGRKGLQRDYALIKGEPPNGSFETSKSKVNLPKNRYTDVLCFDHSRVKLSIEDDDPSTDYINANLVDGYRHKNAFISTQGPLPRTFGDFWRMVWEQMVLLVVMTTRAVERSRLKCGQYWPLEEDVMEQYGEFTVINTGCERHTDYNVTTLILQNNKTNESREVTHFQFTSWPDYGVPHSAGGFLDFMFHVREKQAERTQQMVQPAWPGHHEGPPIVIHCSAGIGRTGTFITMDILTKRLKDIGTVDVNRTVRLIRSQRAFSIQMPDQYVFCHLALIEHAQRQGLLTDVNLQGFEDSSSESEG